jgi:uncharacterized protein
MANIAAEGRTNNANNQPLTPQEFWTMSGTVHGPLAEKEAAQMVQYEEAMVADPRPLGLAALASATFTISAVYAGWFRLSDIVLAIPVMLIFGGITQFLAGMWAFRRGNVLAATTFCTIGALYASWAVVRWMVQAGFVPGLRPSNNASLVNGIFVLTFALIIAYLGLAALAENAIFAATLLVLAIAFAFIGADSLTGTRNWVLYVGGYAGIVAAALAFYTSAAYAINSTMRRGVLPTFPARAMSTSNRSRMNADLRR